MIANGHQPSLRLLNARMRRIDLFCKLAGPLFISLIDGASPKAAILITLALNGTSVAVEYFAIDRVRLTSRGQSLNSYIIIPLLIRHRSTEVHHHCRGGLKEPRHRFLQANHTAAPFHLVWCTRRIHWYSTRKAARSYRHYRYRYFISQF